MCVKRQIYKYVAIFDRNLGPMPLLPCSFTLRCLATLFYACGNGHRRTNKVLKNQNKSSAVAEMGDRVPEQWAEKWEGGGVPVSVAGAGSPSNTMSPEPRNTSLPSGILIHPTVWPQCTNVTDRQTTVR